MDVSIVVVAWNLRELVCDCLRSVFKHTEGIEFEVVYVDNGSKDGTVEAVRRDFPQVRLIENPDNKGFIRASNQGIEVAKGRYVLLLNSDTVLTDNSITKTLLYADTHPEAAVVGCRVRGADGVMQRNCFRFYSPLHLVFDILGLSNAFPNHRLFARKSYGGWNFDTEREVDVVIGCFSLVRMSAIKEVGLMDEIFFTFGDDFDWCIRFVRKGWKVLFYPGTEIIHYGGMNTRHLPDRFTLQLNGSVLIAVKKHYSYSAFLLCRLLTAGLLFSRGVKIVIKALRAKGDQEKARNSARSCWKGSYDCIFDWKNLLMNRAEVESKL